MGDAKGLLRHCLFFTASQLARELRLLAEREFEPTGLTPSQGFALLCVMEEPGITPSEIAERIDLKVSSVSRILEALAQGGLLEGEKAGRRTILRLTRAGRAKAGEVRRAWKGLHTAYSRVLGREASTELCSRVLGAATALGDGRRPESAAGRPSVSSRGSRCGRR